MIKLRPPIMYKLLKETKCVKNVVSGCDCDAVTRAHAHRQNCLHAYSVYNYNIETRYVIGKLLAVSASLVPRLPVISRR